MAQIFQISDGTTTIDLLSPTGNYHLAKWESGISQWKDGGVFLENPFSDGRIPIDRSYGTVQEKITIHITGSSQDNVISSLRSLINLLDKSYYYFVNNTGIPVYFIVKSDTETNQRYGTVVSYSINNLPGQFDGPFLTGGKQFSGNLSYPAIYIELDIVIERDHWSNSIPGNSTAISIENQYAYNSITYGQAASSTNPIQIVSKRYDCNITHIYRYDSSATSWSSNLAGGSLPFNILPSSTTANDAVYFGINTALSNSGPFFNLVFNIGTPATGIAGNWEVYTGSWVNLYGSDGTQTPPISGLLTDGGGSGTPLSSFTKAGLGVVSFTAGGGGYTSVNLNTLLGGSAPSVAGFWVRFRVVSVVTPSVPQQSTQQIFTATRPYININSASIGGDIPAITKLTVYGRAGLKKTIASSSYIVAGALMVGIRKYSRGVDFTSYLNAAQEQNPGGITVTTSGTFPTTSANNSPTGASLQYNTLAVNSTGYTKWSFDSTIAKQYMGNFRVFLRFFGTAETTQHYITMTAGEMNLYTSDAVTVYALPDYTTGENLYYDADYNIADLGMLSIPYTNVVTASQINDLLESFDITVYSKNIGVSSTNITICDLVLIPADESIVEVREILNSNTASNGIYYNRYLEVDNVSLPSRNARSVLRSTSTNNIVNIYRLVNTTGLTLPIERSYLWFFYRDVYIPTSTANPELNVSSPNNDVFSVKLNTSNRYLIPRGNV